jgi:ubiquinol-cytochrome c reductase cytochrome c1 subunit
VNLMNLFTARIASAAAAAVLLGAVLGGSTAALAAGGGYQTVSVRVDLDDRKSLQRGARTFINYCLSCHSAAFMRYNRMGDDLGLTEAQVTENLMFTTDKVGNTMDVAFKSEDAQTWFGVIPPDLSVIARARGEDWLYTYLMTFYKDESRPFGVNNLMFPAVGMPHVFESLQGIQRLKPLAEGAHPPSNPLRALEIETPGSRSSGQFSKDMRDLVAFLVYMGEPAKLERYDLGMKVILFLLIFLWAARALKKEYWKDVH